MTDLVEIVADAMEPYERLSREARACLILTAIEKAGHRIVPVEPTDEMWRAGTDSLKRALHSADGIYRAMVEAAPKVSA